MVQLVLTCPVAVIELIDGKAVFPHEERCIGCTGCFQYCPTRAICDIKRKFADKPQYYFNEYQLCDSGKFFLKTELKKKYEQ
ncbi:4Fe-4S_ferredoxin iron-sulfur binding domain protein [Hexamita inflata]|uniref:4Fe-4S ferredoxin iron-sulfur binding domain protein n=1 Tax=Hexamita inflata TaxID=28002 RepID=A0AA86PHH9_9EUKA|nr:4Fe-4S ferredoxin iron-sulfur binding domain protein [Hexamita inflata]